MSEPWPLVIRELPRSDIPPDILARLQSMPDAVEELSDALEAISIASGIDLGDWCANRATIAHVGPIVTMRFAPKAVRADDMRMGNAQLAPLLPAGAIVVEEAHGCEGCVLGGFAAGLLSRGGAKAAIIDGVARDPGECDAAGLAVIARTFGVRTGRETLQAVEIGGPVTVRGRLFRSGDVGVVNRNGIVAIPSWLAWDDVRKLKPFA